MNWDDLNARARGLATHLPTRATLADAARAADLTVLAMELTRLESAGAETAPTGAALELACRRVAGARLRTIERWAGNRTAALIVIFGDEDRRSITAMFRGAVQGAPAEQRLSGLLPTPALPERALEELARQPGAAAVGALLTAWHHPLAVDLGTAILEPEPDLLRLETAVNGAFARVARKAAARAGRRGTLLRHVRQLIDLENALCALALSREPPSRAADYWVPGGAQLPLPVFERVVAAAGPGGALAALAAVFQATPLAEVFAAGDSPGDLEAAITRAQIRQLHQEARHNPLSAAPLLAYTLRLRAQLVDLRWLIWGTVLQAPAAMLADGLVTPA